MRQLFVSFTVVLVTALSPTSTRAQSADRADQCVVSFTGVPMQSRDPTRVDTTKDATILADAINIPKIRMRFVDLASRKPVVVQRVRAEYYWLWLEWPYPEHRFGKWSDAVDFVDCNSDGGGELVIPAHTVRPRGWYSGTYTRFPFTLTGSTKPNFDRIEIVLHYEGCSPRLVINKRDVALYKNSTAVMGLRCAGSPTVSFKKQ